MRTEAAESLQKHILDVAKRLRDTATMYAVQYASSDDPKAKEAFERHTFAAEEIEAMIPKEASA